MDQSSEKIKKKLLIKLHFMVSHCLLQLLKMFVTKVLKRRQAYENL